MNRATRIRQKLNELNPAIVEILNESDSHSGPPGRETHFKVLVVSNLFENLSRIDRHRKVQDLLAQEMKTGLHALTMRTLTPDEWEKQKHDPQFSFVSPECKK